MTVRFYSSVATAKTLSVTINAGATTMTLSDATGLPTSYPFTMAVNFGDVNEELVDVTNAAGTTFDITRGVDGTTATSHTAGATVRHVASARDFADSRAHENATAQVHGLGVGDDLVGTIKVQSLSNKTLVNATGSLSDIDINSTASHIIDIVKNPAGTDTNTAIKLTNGTEEGLNVANSGRIRILNPVAYDTLNTNRRFQVTLSNGTTETFYINTSGMATASPRSGSLSSQGGFKFLPQDAVDRPAFWVRDSGDTTDRFRVSSDGHVDITGTDPASSQLDIKGASSQSASFMRVQNSSNDVLVNVDSTGQLVANRCQNIFNDASPGSTVLQVQGNAAQTADLQQWRNGASTVVAQVNADGTFECAALTDTTSVVSAATGWTTTVDAAAVRAGVTTVNCTMTRTGGDIVADAAGNISDTDVGTIAADYRPNAVFGSNSLIATGTNGFGSGAVRLNASTGQMTLVSWNSSATLQNGTGLQITYSYVGV